MITDTILDSSYFQAHIHTFTMKFLPFALLLVSSSHAFTLQQTKPRVVHSLTNLHAANGAPQYDKFEATLHKAEVLGEGSVMLNIDTQESVEYEPGHVLALEMETDDSIEDDKTTKDAKDNGGWLRGPYTVSRSTDKTIDILIKVVGDKSKRFSTAKSGTPMRFGGKFHVPILEGIDVDTTKRVVMISTGVGIGPVVGAVEKALEKGDFPPIDLIASYRYENEVVYKDHLNKLQTEHSDKFSWKTIISSEQGRLSSSEENLKVLTDTSFNADIDSTHYHLIGNGSMVGEFKSGLKKAGVPDEKVTVEMYFNHQAKSDGDVVDRIADSVMETAASAAR